MSRAREIDNTDFRPFFDMVVGILFVLLILVSALIFFQRSDDGVSDKERQNRQWLLQRNAFLDRLADDLRRGGIPAQSDHKEGAVVASLSGVATIGDGGSPTLKDTAMDGLGRALETAVGCVSIPRGEAATCPDMTLLALNTLAIQTRLGVLPPGSVLPQDRAARLVSALMSAAMFKDHAGLLKASNLTGNSAIEFGSALTNDQGSADRPLAGDVTLTFSFDPP